MRPTRRAVLGAFVSAGGWLLLGCSSDDDGNRAGDPRPISGSSGSPEDPLPAPAPASRPGGCPSGFVGGTFVRVVPFENEGPAMLDVPIGAGLDGRLYDDLSTLTPEAKTTPTSRFYIRTRYPDRLDPAKPWRVRVSGLVAEEVLLSLDDLAPLVGPRGVHLLECSGNGGGAFFGMVSTAEWDGVPLLALLDAKTKRLSAATRVLVSGFDQHSQPSRASTTGASWIFTLAELAETGAFLATRMNGEPLPPDHGAPLRLVVPGWYGCTCIKWVDGIAFVDDSAPATSQMLEFASRTMQNGMPSLARDYLPAEIDQTAMPVRVEEWNVGGRLVYRVLGIAWGGKRPTEALAIRMNDDLPFARVVTCAPMTSSTTWSWWSYAFRPLRPGAHAIRLRVDDPTIRTRRLDSGFYQRVVVL